MAELGQHRIEYKTLGPFVTHVKLHHKEGSSEYAARPVRKGVRWIQSMQLNKEDQAKYVVCTRQVNYWVAVLFMIGASLFSLPGFLPDSCSVYFNIRFFCGSIFFTSAAYLQFSSVLSAENRRCLSSRNGKPIPDVWWSLFLYRSAAAC